MRNKYILVILFLVLTINLISAVEIKLSKDKYQPMETLQAEITGNFISLNSENIQLYKSGIPRQMPVISGMTKQNNVYYFYAILPDQLGDYSLKIQDSKYISEGELKTEDIIKEFKIQKTKTNETNQSVSEPIENVLSINPGFVIATEDYFEIKIKSLDANQEAIAELEETNETKTLSLVPYSEQTLKFTTPDSKQSSIKINDYTIPVFVIKKGEPVIQNQKLIITPLKLEATLSSGNAYSFNFLLSNQEKFNLTNITFSSDLTEITISPSMISLDSGKSSFINISLAVPENAEDNITGEILVESESFEEKISIPVSIKITPNKAEVNLSGASITETLKCSSQKGKVCSLNENCAGEISPSLEGSCCIGECLEIKESNMSTIIGVILLLVVVLLIIFFVWRARKKLKPVSANEILRQKSERYRSRTNEDSDEVSGRLDKI